ncbi:MAG: hypothetical protein AB7K24_20555, partial [Gemmataceae bacterium]
MAEQQILSPAARAKVGTSTGCPSVADLINFALGQISCEDRHRIETHLHDGDCSCCRGWIEKAAQHRAEPMPRVVHCQDSLELHNHVSPPPVNDQTPIPPSSKWQQAAFRDLEDRLRRLDELA